MTGVTVTANMKCGYCLTVQNAKWTYNTNQFLEYEYTAPNVGPFIGFSIKIVMSSKKMDKYPRIRDIRAIGLA